MVDNWLVEETMENIDFSAIISILDEDGKLKVLFNYKSLLLFKMILYFI